MSEATTTTVGDRLAGRRLKDLSEGEFEAVYGCDRFTAAVLASRLRYTVQHMSTYLGANAFSVILRDWFDFAATVSGPPELDYPMPAVSNNLMAFIGVMTDAVRNSVEEYGVANLREGDVLVSNDPNRTGTHVNDTCFIRPVFRDELLVGFVTIQAHMLDMGGVVPGGFSGTKTQVYENGLVIPPSLLYKEDQPYRPMVSLILDNARWGAVLLADFQTIFANLRLGERLLLETIDRYGLDAYYGALRYASDTSAEALRETILALPDGVYQGEDVIDCDGIDDTEEYRVQVTIRVAGENMEVDLSGTSRQARTSINGSWLDTKTGVAVALKFLLEPRFPFTSGTLRNVDIVLPPATICSAVPPDGVIFLYWCGTQALMMAIFRALGNALGAGAVAGDFSDGSLHSGNGVGPDGIPWMSMAQCGGEHGPWGATERGDADSCMNTYIGNGIEPAVEAIEADAPIVILRKEYATDSGGAGANRGGAAIVKDSLWLSAAEHYSMPMHTKQPSGGGVHGGAPGPAGGVWMWDAQERTPEFLSIDPEVYADAVPIGGVVDPASHLLKPDGEYFHFARVPIWRTSPNAVWRYRTNAGGGWGDPLERDPERVLRDVRDEYVSIEGAREQYGVVVKGDPLGDPEGLIVDHHATDALRRSMRD